jgi:hypothetical protein
MAQYVLLCVLLYVLLYVADVCAAVVRPFCSYEQCFDQWYKDVFLQHKANGVAGCQEEYKAYWTCFMVRIPLYVMRVTYCMLAL